jgi:hypothetical protein
LRRSSRFSRSVISFSEAVGNGCRKPIILEAHFDRAIEEDSSDSPLKEFAIGRADASGYGRGAGGRVER